MSKVWRKIFPLIVLPATAVFFILLQRMYVEMSRILRRPVALCYSVLYYF